MNRRTRQNPTVTVKDVGAVAKADVLTDAYISFAGKGDGDPPNPDSGQTATWLTTLSGRKPQVSSGRLVRGSVSLGSGSYADYYQVPLGAAGVRVGTRFVWPTSPTVNGSVGLGLWNSVYQAGVDAVPSAACHLAITPRDGATGTWVYGVSDGTGPGFLANVKSGTYVNPPRDGSTVWTVDAFIDRAGGVVTIVLPDGSIVTITDAEISAAFTAASLTPVPLASLGSQVAMVEHYATTLGSTSVYPEFVDFWASSVPAPAYGRFVTPGALQRAIKALVAPIPDVYKVHAPTTQLSLATTTSFATIDSGFLTVNTVAGPTGKVLVEARAFYEFSADDVLFWQIRDSNASVSSPSLAAHVGTSGEKVLVSQLMVIDTFTPGQAVSMKLRHMTASSGSATLKAGGTSPYRPPATLRATAL